jgi:alpha-L-rhamnosidase
MQLRAEIPSGTTALVLLPDGTEHLIGTGVFETSAALTETSHALNERTNA